MKIGIGSDHRGYKLKKNLTAFLERQGHTITDVGTHSEDSCNYPEFALKVAKGVARGNFDRGILICNSGLGMAMAASTIKGVRAANCFNLSTARYSREHNDANVLVLGAAYIKPALASRIAAIWFKTEFAGGRHQERIDMFSNSKLRKKE